MTANNTQSDKKFVSRNTNTKTITFTYGLAKNAELEVPTEDCSIVSITQLVHKSLVKHKLGKKGLFSDGTIIASLGTSNFLEGAYIGWRERFKDAGMDQKIIDTLKDSIFDEKSIALAVAEYRYGITKNTEVYKFLSENKEISDDLQKYFTHMIEVDKIING